MSGRPSLADRAVYALAVLAKFYDGVSNTSPERYAVLKCKHAAEQALDDAFNLVLELRDLADAIKKAAEPQDAKHE